MHKNLRSQLETFVSEVASRDDANPRPWLPAFIDSSVVARTLSSRTERVFEDLESARGRTLVVSRYKPDRDVRTFVLTEVEFELAVTLKTALHVRELEERRNPELSHASRVRAVGRDSSLWTNAFRPADRTRFVREQRRLKTVDDWIILTDVRRYFPELTFETIAHRLATAAGLPRAGRKELLMPLRIVAETEALPVGPALSKVIGNFMLTGADSWLSWHLGPLNVLRWMDDFNAAASSRGDAWELLRAFEAGPVRGIGCRLNKKKTDVMPAKLWQPNGAGSLVEDPPDDADHHEQLSRASVRAAVDLERARHANPHEAALRVAGQMRRLQRDLRWVIREVTSWCDGALPADVHDLMADSLATAAKEPGATDDPACGLTLLADSKVDGSMGRAVADRLIEMATTDALPPRAQASASWLLASRERFSRVLLRDLDTRHRVPARATLAAAHTAGAKITATQAARSVN
jgi:hypothetical protein